MDTHQARPRYDESTALIVVDAQNDVTDPEGTRYVPGAEEALPRINAEIATARQAGALVVYTQNWHPGVTAHFEKHGGTWPVHCVAGTWGAELHPELVLDGLIVRKGTGGAEGYSGFNVRDPESGEQSATELDRLLSQHGVDSVYIVGFARDVCVKATALDARERGYATTVITDATRAVDAHAGERALRELANAGADFT